jgi:hypothetical protein
MSIAAQKYIRKPLYVDAVRVTAANFNDIAAWCQGEIQLEGSAGNDSGKKFIKVRVHNPRDPRQTMAFVGDWLLYTERGYKIYNNKAFHSAFDLVEEGTPKVVGAEQRDYPYSDGDVIVLGPECFVAKDGSVMSWKGQNYVPQVNPAIIDAIEELHKAQAKVVNVPSANNVKPVRRSVENVEGEQFASVAKLPTVSDTIPPVPDNVEAQPEQESIEPAAAEGKRVLSVTEQRELTRDQVKELLQSGEVVLAQDLAEPTQP